MLDYSFDSCYYYATNQHDQFIDTTDGQRHRDMVKWIMNHKHTNSLIRERIVAQVLGLNHNPRMHSTSSGITTYDASNFDTGIHYEIKTEQHNTRHESDVGRYTTQIKGAGQFSGISSAKHIDTLLSNDPVIAHGIFIDGFLCGLATFKLSETPSAVNRLYKYSQSSMSGKLTKPKYMFNDWISNPKTQYCVFSYRWPKTVCVKYRAIFESAATSGIAKVL